MTWVDRRAPAVERILDAAGGLFAESGVEAVSMAQIAAGAGCSRATLYRYFPDRPALQLAFVQREAVRVGALVAAERPSGLVDAVLAALRHVRANPALLAWFGDRDAAHTADLAQGSEVVEAIGLSSVTDADSARWLVRVIVSLLTVPGGDEAEERRLLERFVAPVVTPRTVGA